MVRWALAATSTDRPLDSSSSGNTDLEQPTTVVPIVWRRYYLRSAAENCIRWRKHLGVFLHVVICMCAMVSLDKIFYVNKNSSTSGHLFKWTDDLRNVQVKKDLPSLNIALRAM